MADWPDHTDLENHVGTGQLQPNRGQWPGIVAAATLALRGTIDESKLPEDGTCPDDLRLAILIYAHRLATRPTAAMGIVPTSSGDEATRLARTDPDIPGLIGRLMLDPEP
ncbi:MAG: hypothetical protein AAGA37_19800 [Actinomycetota bacterium]